MIGRHNYALNAQTPTFIGGNVGIGVENPSQALTVAGNIFAGGYVQSPDLYCDFISIGGYRWCNGQGRQVVYYGGDGRNYYKGASGIPHTWRRGDDIMSLTGSGNLRASGAFTNISDTRIKKEIKDIDDNEGLIKYY